MNESLNRVLEKVAKKYHISTGDLQKLILESPLQVDSAREADNVYKRETQS